MTEEHRINIMADEVLQPQIEQPAEEETPQIAGIAERFIALLIDWGMISILYQIALIFIVRMVQPDLTLLYWLLAGVVVPFILYETIFTCGGRSTLGKKLVGIRVVDYETGEPLSFCRAFVRAIGYFLSGALLMCGFLMAFIDGKHRALQDYMAKSVVLQAREKDWVEKTALTVVGFVLIFCFAGYFYKQFFGAGSWMQQVLVYRAQEHVEKIGYLEEIHRMRFGYYTNDLLRLALLSGDPVQFQRDTNKVLDRRGFRIGVGEKGYKIAARAKDAKKTPVFYPNGLL